MTLTVLCVVWLVCCNNTDDRLCSLLAITNIIVGELNLQEIAVQFVSVNDERNAFWHLLIHLIFIILSMYT